jgi:sucrose phosphorylase
MKNQVQLITYVDRLSGGGLRELAALLHGPLRGLFGGVHLLPFFEAIDGADAGFDPSNHTCVDPRLGDWGDVAALAADVDVMADLIVNHISRDSPQFRDFLAKGSASPLADLFLTRERVFPRGANEADLGAIYRPRPGLPFAEVTLTNGERRHLWTTFTPNQVDIDVTHARGQEYIERILRTFADNGVAWCGSTLWAMPSKPARASDSGDPRHRRLSRHVRASYGGLVRSTPIIASRSKSPASGLGLRFRLPPLVLHAFAFARLGRSRSG